MKLSKSFDELILSASRLSLNNLRSPTKKKAKNVRIYSNITENTAKLINTQVNINI